ncbi:MAG: hypothetical protein IJ325_05810 [Clostridia bacterium]|nr:hypothetical protein [Clostridia bacterium]
MITVKSKILFLVLCVLQTIWLLFAQIINSVYLLIPCLVCFLALTVWSTVKGMVMPVLLFFLPFTPLMKIRPGTISFFTVALIAVYLMYIVMGSKKINIYHLIPAFLLIALILVVKTLKGYAFENSYILFSISLLLVPFLAREMDNQYDFYWLTIFFAAGIIAAAVSSQYLDIFPTILRYIAKHEFSGGIRHAGYYGDPNFYSAHINAALGGVMVLLLNSVKKGRSIMLFLMAMLLLYCGFLSVSKSFLVIALCLILFFIVEILFSKGKVSAKLMILLTFGVGTVFVLSFTVFTDLIDMMITRLSSGSNLSDFTTRRTELWVQYLNVIIEDIPLLLFGQGYTNVLISDRSSHNTILQAIYQFGIVGGTILLGWIICHVRTLLAGIKIRINHITQIFILLIGTLGPWLGLDYLFFDEFFLIPIYLCAGIRMLVGADDTETVSLQ